MHYRHVMVVLVQACPEPEMQVVVDQSRRVMRRLLLRVLAEIRKCRSTSRCGLP
jgi:hypothetical protein